MLSGHGFHVKAHTDDGKEDTKTHKNVPFHEPPVQSDFHTIGNDRADELARAAADAQCHAVSQGCSDQVTKEVQQVTDTLKRAVAIAQFMQEKESEDLPKDRIKMIRITNRHRVEQLLRRPWHSSHRVLEAAAGALFCYRCCSRSPPTWGGKLLWLRQGCGRTPRPHSSHMLMRSGSLVWCTRCGAYSAKRHKQLLRPCAGEPTPLGKMTMKELQQGRMPPSSGYAGQPLGHAAVPAGDAQAEDELEVEDEPAGGLWSQVDLQFDALPAEATAQEVLGQLDADLALIFGQQPCEPKGDRNLTDLLDEVDRIFA